MVPPHLVHSNRSGEGFSNYYLAVEHTRKQLTHIIQISDNERGDLYHCVEQAYFYFNGNIPGKTAILQCLAELIRQYLLMLSGSSSLSQYSERIVQNVIANFSDPKYRPMQYIRTLPFSAEYLCKKFQKELGCTPNQYLVRLRMEHAEKMLQQRAYGLSIKEIAEACGYADALYFSRVFRVATGRSPSGFAAGKECSDE